MEDSTALNFVSNTGAGPGKQAYVSTILSGYQLAVIDPEPQDGQSAPGVIGIIGTSRKPVSAGRVFGDLTRGLPRSLGVAYLKRRQVGPLAPNLLFTGSLQFATFDPTARKLGTATDLLPGTEISEFDLAVHESCLYVLAATGSGALVLAMYDAAGVPIGACNLPVGPWTKPGHWVAGPTIVATATGFAFAFVDMDGRTPVALYVGTLSPRTP